MLDGAKLKFLRYMHGKTQKEVAEWCDVNLRFVKGVERNEYNPSQEVYEAWLNCIYDIGEPIKREKPTQESQPPTQESQPVPKRTGSKSPSKRRTTTKK